MTLGWFLPHPWLTLDPCVSWFSLSETMFCPLESAWWHRLNPAHVLTPLSTAASWNMMSTHLQWPLSQTGVGLYSIPSDLYSRLKNPGFPSPFLLWELPDLSVLVPIIPSTQNIFILQPRLNQQVESSSNQLPIISFFLFFQNWQDEFNARNKSTV